MLEDRRLIEETFPIREVSEEAAREKNLRHGNLSTLHIWWARKPGASSRATNYAALVRCNKRPPGIVKQRRFVIKLSKWARTMDRATILEARNDILQDNGGIPPKILDPFAGGGSIPFEAMRLGCETFAGDYNPVATILLKCALEYPNLYGGARIKRSALTLQAGPNKLLEDVRQWGKWVLDEAQKELGKFYPAEPDGSVPVAYVWARTIPCQNPACGAELPLITGYWLSKKSDSSVFLKPRVEGKKVRFSVERVSNSKLGKGFNPDKGTVSRAVATCLVCGSVVDNVTTAALFRKKLASHVLLAVVSHKRGVMGKKYRESNDRDLKVFTNSDLYLQEKARVLSADWGLSAVPDEPTPEGGGRGAERAFAVRHYGMNTWGDLFNSRQKLAMITFIEKVRLAHDKMIDSGLEKDYARAVTAYLALGVDRLADFGSILCMMNATGGRGVFHTFSRLVLQMVWNYAESNPFNPEGAGWPTACEKNEDWIEHASSLETPAPVVFQASATHIAYPENFFDAVFTDPPYYDNVPYSHLSDFFYVWLKRSIGDLYPDLFATSLTPKSDEIVAYSNTGGGLVGGKQDFEDRLRKAFTEINRVVKPGGISLIIYAHKSTAGWETLINSLLDSGLVISGSWPVHTEMKGRLRSQESAALASSIYLVARKMHKEDLGFYKEVKTELKSHLSDTLDNLWGEGISGADFFIASIGSAVGVFGKYVRIIDDEGNSIRADRLLEDTRRMVTDYAMRRVLHNGFAAQISPMTRFYVLWRWAYADASLDFDDATKLAQGVGIDLTQEWNRGFIRKEKELISILGPEDRESKSLEGSKELIDVLHNVLLLWKKGKTEEITQVMKDSGFGRSDTFYSVAQAISESLPPDNKEKKLLEGFIPSKQRISEEVREGSEQTRLFE